MLTARLRELAGSAIFVKEATKPIHFYKYVKLGNQASDQGVVMGSRLVGGRVKDAVSSTTPSTETASSLTEPNKGGPGASEAIFPVNTGPRLCGCPTNPSFPRSPGSVSLSPTNLFPAWVARILPPHPK